MPLEVEHGLLRRYRPNNRFFYGSWKVWPPESAHTSPRIKELKNHPVSKFEKQVFPSLTGLLDDLGSPQKPAKHRVLLVPDELKASVENLVLTRWLNPEGEGATWSLSNPALSLYHMDGAKPLSGQDEVLENLDALRSVTDGIRGVYMADLSDLIRIGRSYVLGSRNFRLKDVALQNASGLAPKLQPRRPKSLPHILYMLETEGRRVALTDFENDETARQVSMLLIGTQAEWEAINRDLTPESRVGVAERFEVQELPIPSVETRRRLLRNFLDDPQIQGLKYTFSAKGILVSDSKTLSAEEEIEAVLGFMVNKCELLARQSNKEVITTFVQFMNVFSKSLVVDDTLRRRKIIDRVFVERLFSKVFSMPLNLAVLLPTTLWSASAIRMAVLDMQAAGYEGPIDLKLRVIQALLAQTRVDPVRTIPSSIILFGETRSGKTLLFKTLVKMLKLTLYDYAKPNENEAQAIIINVGKLRPTPKVGRRMGKRNDDGHHAGGSEVMTVEQAIRHIQNFLSGPNGYRGYLLFDDIHLASDEVRSEDSPLSKDPSLNARITASIGSRI